MISFYSGSFSSSHRFGIHRFTWHFCCLSRARILRVFQATRTFRRWWMAFRWRMLFMCSSSNFPVELILIAITVCLVFHSFRVPSFAIATLFTVQGVHLEEWKTHVMPIFCFHVHKLEEFHATKRPHYLSLEPKNGERHSLDFPMFKQRECDTKYAHQTKNKNQALTKHQTHQWQRCWFIVSPHLFNVTLTMRIIYIFE